MRCLNLFITALKSINHGQRLFRHTDSPREVYILHRQHHFRTPLSVQIAGPHLLETIKSDFYLQLHCLRLVYYYNYKVVIIEHNCFPF